MCPSATGQRERHDPHISFTTEAQRGTETHREFYDRQSSFPLVLSSVFLCVSVVRVFRLAADCLTVRAHGSQIDADRVKIG